MSLLERLNHAFSGGIMFVQPTAENYHTLSMLKIFKDPDINNYRELKTARGHLLPSQHHGNKLARMRASPWLVKNGLARRNWFR